MKQSSLVLACIAALANCLGAAELWVDSSATVTGDGSAARPFRTATEACKAAKGGDVITLRGGVYRESLTIAQSGTPQNPTTLRAAAGERVIISGFAPIANWKDEGGGIYSATIQGNISDLYVGLQRQPVSRWPDLDSPMRRLTAPKTDAAAFSDGASLADESLLREVAASPKDLMAFIYMGNGNRYTTAPVKAVNPASGEVMLAATKLFASLKGVSDRYQLANHRALIQKPGHWAYETIDGKNVRVYFRPHDAADLQKTQFPMTRRGVYVGHHQNRVSHVLVEGLEIEGSAGIGLEVGNAAHVTLAGNIVCFNAANGIGVRDCEQITVRNNIVMANGNGVGIASALSGLVEHNEIALNMVDGLIVAGNISGRAGAEPETSDVLVRRNYIHHHLLMGHPDSIQTYRGVKNLRIEDTLALWSGQGIMTEETDGASINNSVVAGTSAIAVIFGHNNSNNWKVTNSTIGLGGWGIFSLTGQGYFLRNNIAWDGAIPQVQSLDSDCNLLWRSSANAPVSMTTKPYSEFATPADIAAASGREQHSLRADPRFRSAPAFQAVSSWDDANRADELSLTFRGNRKDVSFAKGDKIEINGDGILRQVTEVTPEYLRFEPALPQRPFRESLIWNWKDSTSTTLDLRTSEDSPAINCGENGQSAGAKLDIPAYQRGDFDGDGKRDIPTLPEDVKKALPGPTSFVLPLQGQ